MSQEIWTVLKLIQWTTDYFKKNKIENPRLNVEYMIGKVTGLDRVELYLNFDKILSAAELAEFKDLIKKRINGEPLQYLLGETSFYGYPIKVNPQVLIPRPETELLVETIVEDLQKVNPGVIADLGTGSGCIAIALAKELPLWRIIATDISDEALVVAKDNAINNDVSDRLQFYQQDMKQQLLPESQRADVIVSNPPYVTADEFQTLPKEIKEYEPEIALHDGGNGLSFYRKILANATNFFANSEGRIYFELGYQSAGNGVDKLANDSGYTDIEIIQDYSGINRIMKAKYEK